MSSVTRRSNSRADLGSPALNAAAHDRMHRVAHRFSGGGHESGCNSRPPRLKPWATPAQRATPRRGVLLLEVIVALTIMVSAMGLLGAQLVGGIKMTMYAEEQTRAAQLADRMLALLELDPNTVTRFVAEREADGDFGEQYPEWFWRAYAEELEETEDLEQEQRLSRVTIEILHQPGVGLDADIEDARAVRRLHLLKAAPAMIDLEEDFGVPAEKVETIMELIASIAPDAITETGEIDIRVLMQFTGIEDLFALMPMLAGLAGGGFGDENLAGLLGGEGLSSDVINSFLEAGLGGDISPDMIQGLLSGAGGDFGAGNADAILQMIQSQLGGQLSADDLNFLLSNIGQGGLGGGRGGDRGGRGGGRGGERGSVGDRPAEGEERPPRDIRDLDRERDERNREWKDR